MKRTLLVGAGLLFVFIAMILQGFDSPATGIALVAGLVLLFLGLFSWAYKLHWYVALIIGGMLLVAACFSGAYIPLIVSSRGEDMPEFFIHLVNFALGIPAIVLISAGVASLFR